MRAVQPPGARGSLKWIQQAIEERWHDLESPILRKMSATSIEWRSPIRSDNFAEYRDGAFLELLGLSRMADKLAEFWPRRGPQWDALGCTNTGQVLLVEAKAHIGEFCTPGTTASDESRTGIEASLTNVALALGSTKGTRWPDLFYQYANRLAHLWFLRQQGVDAYLVLVGFIGDAEMKGPSSSETWNAAYQVADYGLGLSARHPMSQFVIHAFPEVTR